MNLLLQTFCHPETLFLGLQVSKNSWILSAFSLVADAWPNLTTEEFLEACNLRTEFSLQTDRVTVTMVIKLQHFHWWMWMPLLLTYFRIWSSWKLILSKIITISSGMHHFSPPPPPPPPPHPPSHPSPHPPPYPPPHLIPTVLSTLLLTQRRYTCCQWRTDYGESQAHTHMQSHAHTHCKNNLVKMTMSEG